MISSLKFQNDAIMIESIVYIKADETAWTMTCDLVFKTVVRNFQREGAWQVLILIDTIFLELVLYLRQQVGMLAGLILAFPLYQGFCLWLSACNFYWTLYPY